MKAFIVLSAVLACAMANPGLVYSNIGAYSYPGVHYAQPAVTYAAAPAVTYTHTPAVTYAATPTVYNTAVVAPVATKTQYHAQDELGQASYGYAHPGQAHAAVRDAAGNVRGSYAYVDPTGKNVRVDYVADHNGFRVDSNALPQGPVASLVAPNPVQETPEVAAARAAHLSAHHEAKHRQRRGVVYTSPLTYSHPWVGHHQALTYSSVPAVTYASPVTTYAAAPLAHTYTSVVNHPVRAATLTKVINNPGHAVSYRVD